MDIEALAERARDDISDYCINECKAECCKKGHLLISEQEFKEMLGSKNPLKLPHKSILKDGLGNVLLDFNRMNGCPALNGDDLCKIHKNPIRSQTCKDFPIFIRGKEIHIHARCLAAFEGKLYSFTYQAMELGYKIVDND